MKKKYHAGFSLPELLIVLTILAVLFSLTAINLLTAYHKNTLHTSVTTLTSDLKHQQLKAMVGDTEGQTSSSPYGIFFQPNNYTLFRGSAYSSSEASNFIIALNSDLQFSNILVPDSQVIFAKGNGEISNYIENFNYVTLKNIRTDETKTIQINQLGTILNIY
ncbi:type II secretion system protein [Candidatus Roizmanbacteria bacterium]|nr:type II secretion system protein [Candidatus Roizmanbacteria bacterium]